MIIQKRLYLTVIGLVAAVLALPVFSFADGNILDKPVSILEQWIDIEKTVSKEQSDWEIEQASIEDILKVRKDELAMLKERIEKSAQATTEAEKKRGELTDREDQLKANDKIVEEAVIKFETELLELIRFFPRPLQEEISPLANRIPKDPENTGLSKSQRMQNIVGILTQVDKFNSAVTVVPELRRFGDDENLVEVKTIYFGLAIAYYVDGGASKAGYGLPDADKWLWMDRPDLAESIYSLIDIYEKNKAEARYITLPIEIK